MNCNLKAKLHNRFDIEVRDAKTGVLKQEAKAYNIVLNSAWAYILTTAFSSSAFAWFRYIHFGKGTGTLSPSNTTLFNSLGYKEVTTPVYGYKYDVEEAWCSLRQRITLTENEYVGETITEVGISGVVGTLCTHALLQDMNGNVVSITKSDTDIIYIYATVYLILPPYDPSAHVDFVRSTPDTNPLLTGLLGRFITVRSGGTGNNYSTFPRSLVFKHDTSVFPKDETFFPRTLHSVTIDPTVNVSERTASWTTRLGATVANGDSVKKGIRSGAVVSAGGTLSYGAIEYKFDNPYHTHDPVIEQIGTGDGETTDFSTVFPFVKSGAVIKVNDVLAEPTVYTGLPMNKDLLPYIVFLVNNEYGAVIPEAFSRTALWLFENPFYSNYGIDYINGSYILIYVSDNASDWTLAASNTTSGSVDISIPAEYRNKRYWKCERHGTNSMAINSINCNALDNFKNVRFSSPPAEGAVIMAEYDSEYATKDSNHVLDVTVTIQLGEYVEEY